MKQCPYCGVQLNDDSLFCTECGKPLPQINVCPHCGAPMNDGDSFCQSCGKMPNEVITQTPYQSVSYPERGSSGSWGKVLFIVLSIILLAGLSVGGYFFYSDYSKKKAQEEARLKAERAEQERVQNMEKQDAADWEFATSENTEEAYLDYLLKHEDGKHVAEAQKELNKIDSQKLSDSEAYDVSNTIEGFFNSLSAGNEEDMLKCISPVMDNFLGKAGATKVDAISFMRRLHADDVYSVNISLDSNDIHVSKTLQEGASPVYQAEFSYDQRLEREDTSLETFASIKGSATLNENFKITSMSLKKMSSY